MKKLLSFLAVAAVAAIGNAQSVKPAYSVLGKDTICQVFIYSPGDRAGLHLAYLDDNDRWQDVGQLCSSDYGRWGSEKRMYHPFVLHASDGTWRAVWSVNDYAPCIAAAYSEDLITWRPQDYPQMSVQGCRKPIMFQMEDGTFDIYFHSDKGNRYVHASNDFRTFKEDEEPSTIEDVVWTRDTATVGGKHYEGNLFDIPKLHLSYINDYFRALGADGIMSSESMAQDNERFKTLTGLKARVTVDKAQTKAISDKLVGVFFEDISYAADGGLYAELIQNRDFEYNECDHKGWSPSTAWHSPKPIKIATDNPLSKNNPHYAVLATDTLQNEGWDGIAVKSSQQYAFSFYARNLGTDKKQLQVALMGDDGRELAKAKFKLQGEGWTQYRALLSVKADKNAPAESLHNARLVIVPKGEGEAAIDMVSLFPQDTYKGHGLRKDLAETIAALKPKFVRFPGGCMSHGDGLDNIYHWHHTIGRPEDRVPDRNIWNYHQTRGLGFYEYFQFCEDIGAEPLPVLAAGVPCQNSSNNACGYGGQQGGIPMADMPAYCQEFLNLIEWANGDPATSKWAKMRADAGHPAPFHLKYIGVGNEDIISTPFEERCLMICKAIKEKYPDIIVCGTAGPFHYPSADYIEGWKFAKEHHNIIDMVDEHYYESTGWFINHLDYYDHYDRKGPKVYVGEYASRTRTLESALAEALFLCHVERNADVVSMTSYAPLLAKDGHHNWNPDLIYFDNTAVTTTPSYETQRLFSAYSGDRYTASTITAPDVPANRLASSVVSDSKTGKTYLRLVNALPVEVDFEVSGLSIPTGSRITGFGGLPADKKTETVTSSVTKDNHISLPPYSVRNIEI